MPNTNRRSRSPMSQIDNASRIKCTACLSMAQPSEDFESRYQNFEVRVSDICLPDYVQDHRNREGEAMARVELYTLLADIPDAIVDSANEGTELPDWINADAIRRALGSKAISAIRARMQSVLRDAKRRGENMEEYDCACWVVVSWDASAEGSDDERETGANLAGRCAAVNARTRKALMRVARHAPIDDARDTLTGYLPFLSVSKSGSVSLDHDALGESMRDAGVTLSDGEATWEGYRLTVSDHGNATLYSRSRPNQPWREVWAIV